jgi:hypothetical protein
LAESNARISKAKESENTRPHLAILVAAAVTSFFYDTEPYCKVGLNRTQLLPPPQSMSYRKERRKRKKQKKNILCNCIDICYAKCI